MLCRSIFVVLLWRGCAIFGLIKERGFLGCRLEQIKNGTDVVNEMRDKRQLNQIKIQIQIQKHIDRKKNPIHYILRLKITKSNLKHLLIYRHVVHT